MKRTPVPPQLEERRREKISDEVDDTAIEGGGGLRLGAYEGTWLRDTPFWLDGGTMFGIVRRELWAKKAPPDERNRVRFGLNCLLLRGEGRTILVDAGVGSKLNQKERAIYGLTGATDLRQSLATAGVGPDEIDTVILTHLHLDHCGWCTARDAHGTLVPSFPCARHIVQAREWEAAHAAHPLTRGSYMHDDYDPLEQAGLLELVDGDTAVTPSVRTILTGAHSAGHQCVMLESGGARLFCPSELIPTAWHVRPAWVMSYDLDPMRVVDLKRQYMARAVAENWLLFLNHDPTCSFGRLTEGPDRRYTWRAEPGQSA